MPNHLMMIKINLYCIVYIDCTRLHAIHAFDRVSCWVSNSRQTTLTEYALTLWHMLARIFVYSLEKLAAATPSVWTPVQFGTNYSL